MRDRKSENSSPDAEPEAASVPAGNPAAARWVMIAQAARRFNSEHADLVRRFNVATNGACEVTRFTVGIRLARDWQIKHGLRADGKIGPETVEAAEREAQERKKSDGPSDVVVSDSEAATDAGKSHQSLADDAVDSGATEGEERAAPAESTFEGEQLASDGVDRIGADIGGGGNAGKLLLAPHLISLLRQHEMRAALKLVWSSVSQEDRVELLKVVCEKLRGELSEHALAAFAKFAVAGLVLDVLELGWDWTKGGLEAIYEAHEKGDQKARVRIYAYAWADTILRGEHDAAGAVTEEEREAARRGVEDGLATRQAQPELPALLLAEYGNEKMAREKLELSLERKAGI